MGYKIFVFMICASTLNATLGEPYKPTRTSQSQNFANYAVHEVTEPDGLKIREYSDNKGMVFAVAWNGRRHPDLKQILGSHYGTFQKYANSKGRTRSPVIAEEGNLKVSFGGHQRDFRGQALLTNLIPAGLSVESLK